MDSTHFLVRWANIQLAGACGLDAAAVEVANALQVIANVAEDLSLLMGEPALAVEVTASPSDRQRLVAAWQAKGLVVEELDREVLALKGGVG